MGHSILYIKNHKNGNTILDGTENLNDKLVIR